MRWDSKSTFIVSRGVAATVGLARTVAIVRMLSLTDYALVGVVESVRHMISTLLGFGVGDSLSREGAIERDARRQGQLLLVSYANALALSLPIGIAFFLVGLLGERLYDDHRLTPMLAAAFGVSVLERLWLVSLAALRVLDSTAAFIIFGTIYGVLNAVLSVLLIAWLGVPGYFYAQLVNGASLVLMVMLVIFRGATLPTYQEFRKDWRSATIQLWGISWFMYMYKGSMTVWRRLPILLCAPFVSPQVLGAVTAALDLAFKVHLLHQALSPLVIQRLSRAFAQSIRNYHELVREELRDVVLLNVAAFVIAILGWYWFGALILTEERWSLIGDVFYLALMVEATLVIANVSSMCVLVPTKQIDRLTLPTILLRLATFPMVYLLLTAALPHGSVILLSMLLPGIFVAVLYGFRARLVLRTLPQTETRPCRQTN
jgi:O-antigen/teichoic acid export membrane protein